MTSLCTEALRARLEALSCKHGLHASLVATPHLSSEDAERRFVTRNARRATATAAATTAPTAMPAFAPPECITSER